jgi:hypothetical protein
MSARRDGRMPRAEVTTARNGLGDFHDYGYRGERTLAAELPFLCDGGCGRRVGGRGGSESRTCAVCRGTNPDAAPGPGRGHRSDLEQP